MSTSWGLGLDAEIGYRQQRVRADYRLGRGNSGHAAARSKPRSVPRNDTSTTFALPLISARV